MILIMVLLYFQNLKRILWRNYNMETINVIQVKDVHKKFKLYFDRGQSLKEKILFKIGINMKTDGL
jgi:hypothetical protein